MAKADNRLGPGSLAGLIKNTLLVMLGRRPLAGTFRTDADGMWQAIWASLIFTLLVSAFPGSQSGIGFLALYLTIQLVSVLFTVLLFASLLNSIGLSSRLFVFVVPFLWVENVQHLFGGLLQNLVVATGDITFLILITPLIIWSIYWLWRIGRDQLGRGGWLATGLLFLSFVIDAGLFMFLRLRVQDSLG
ncbi:MAG: hypothetical protein GWP36_00500 [Bacteroidetes bacterium]|jgi:hypothetical protein|nr:hypothetical protein [Bacteroidota bacterium]